MDLIKGNNLHENNSKLCQINNEIDFLRMALLLLREMNIFHENDYFHCDISPKNVLSFQPFGFGSYYFILIDYGSSFKKGNQRFFTETPGFTPPEFRNTWFFIFLFFFFIFSF
jgi:hypothetical protein